MKKRSVRRQRQLRRRAILGFLAAIALLLVIGSVKFFTDDVYRSEAQFKEYVRAYFAGNGTGEIDSTIADGEYLVYGKPLSMAARYPKTGMEEPDAYFHELIEDIETDLYADYKEAERSEKIARFVDYKTYSVSEDAVGIVMTREDHHIDKSGTVVDHKKVYVYNYSTKTGERLYGINYFRPGYKAFFSEYLINYFETHHSENLTENYKKYISADVNNLDDFILTNAGVVFYFQPGTVLEEEQGIVSVEIGYVDTGKIVRKNVVLDVIDPDRPMVALTYDDGPYPPTSGRILDCLEKYGQVATFFEVGKNVKAYPEITKRKAKLGMEIGNHSWSHPNLGQMSKKEIESQIDRTNDILEDTCGQSSTVFRPPYGITDSTIQKAADVPVILWSIDTLDWKHRNADKVFNSVKKVHNQGDLHGRVILMHSIYDSTAEATEMLVPWLLEHGYQLVTVSEMIEYGYGEEPVDAKLYGYGYFYK